MFWKGSSAGVIFPPKLESLRFQTSLQEGRKIHVSPCTFCLKIHPNDLELAVEEN